MGFMQPRFGGVRDAWIDNGTLFYGSMFTDAEYSAPTKLDVTIPRQRNEFRSNSVAFYLKHEGLLYIGRYDKTISVVEEKSGLLINVVDWTPPPAPPVMELGKFNAALGLVPAYVDLRDKLTVYANYCRTEGLLAEEAKSIAPECAMLAHYKGHPPTWHWMLVDKEDKEIAVKDWCLQKSIWSGDCREFF